MADSIHGDGEISVESERLIAQSMISDYIGNRNDPPGTRGWVLNKLDMLKEAASDLTTDVRSIRSLILELESYKADRILGWDIGFDELIYQMTMLPPEIVPLVKSQSSTITIGGLIDAARQIREAKQQVLDFNPTAEGKELTREVAKIVGAEGITQEKIGKKLGVSQEQVSMVLGENISESTKIVHSLIIPKWITHRQDIADWGKLSPESQLAVKNLSISLNAACVKEGIRPAPIKLPPLEKAKKQFIQLSEEDRTAFDEWRSGL